MPTEVEIKKERPRLRKMILDFKPDIIVAVGKLSASYCLGLKIDKLDEIIGKEFVADPYKMLGKEIKIIPLPHPSGASIWRHKKENKLLLQKALDLLKKDLSLD